MAGVICPRCLRRCDVACPLHGGPRCESCQQCYCENQQQTLPPDVFETLDESLYGEDPTFWQNLQVAPCRLEDDRIFCVYVPGHQTAGEIRRAIQERWLVRQVFLKPVSVLPPPTPITTWYVACAGKPGAGWLIPLEGTPVPWPEGMEPPGIAITDAWYEIPTPAHPGSTLQQWIRQAGRMCMHTPPFPLAISQAIIAALPHEAWLWHGAFPHIAAVLGLPIVPVPHPWGSMRTLWWHHLGLVEIRSPRPWPAVTVVCNVMRDSESASPRVWVDVQQVLQIVHSPDTPSTP